MPIISRITARMVSPRFEYFCFPAPSSREFVALWIRRSCHEEVFLVSGRDLAVYLLLVISSFRFPWRFITFARDWELGKEWTVIEVATHPRRRLHSPHAIYIHIERFFADRFCPHGKAGPVVTSRSFPLARNTVQDESKSFRLVDLHTQHTS